MLGWPKKKLRQCFVLPCLCVQIRLDQQKQSSPLFRSLSSSTSKILLFKDSDLQPSSNTKYPDDIPPIVWSYCQCCRLCCAVVIAVVAPETTSLHRNMFARLAQSVWASMYLGKGFTDFISWMIYKRFRRFGSSYRLVFGLQLASYPVIGCILFDLHVLLNSNPLFGNIWKGYCYRRPLTEL